MHHSRQMDDLFKSSLDASSNRSPDLNSHAWQRRRQFRGWFVFSGSEWANYCRLQPFLWGLVKMASWGSLSSYHCSWLTIVYPLIPPVSYSVSIYSASSWGYCYSTWLLYVFRFSYESCMGLRSKFLNFGESKLASFLHHRRYLVFNIYHASIDNLFPLLWR